MERWVVVEHGAFFGIAPGGKAWISRVQYPGFVEARASRRFV